MSEFELDQQGHRAVLILLGQVAQITGKKALVASGVDVCPGLRAQSLFDLHDPTLDWVELAEGMGVEAARADTMERFADLFACDVLFPQR